MYENDSKVNNLMTLTVTFMLKKAFSNFADVGGIVFHKHILFNMEIYLK